MVKIKMTGAYSEENDTREFFFVNTDGESPITRIAAGMLVYVWMKDDKVNHYEKDGCEFWELLDT